MQPYGIQYPISYSKYGSSQRPITANGNLAKIVACAKQCENNSKQGSKYTQPRWCPSGLSHTQKRRLQRMRKKEFMEQQAEVVPARSTTMKQVWRPKQVVSSSAWRRSKIRQIEFIVLRIKMADVCLSSSWDNFGPEACFLACKHYQKTGGHMLTTKIARPVWPVPISGPTGRTYFRSGKAPTGLTGGSDRSDRSNWNPSTTRTFCRFRYVIGFLTG